MTSEEKAVIEVATAYLKATEALILLDLARAKMQRKVEDESWRQDETDEQVIAQRYAWGDIKARAALGKAQLEMQELQLLRAVRALHEMSDTTEP